MSPNGIIRIFICLATLAGAATALFKALAATGFTAAGATLTTALAAAALAIAISTIGPGIGQGLAAAHAMDAIARQPEAAGTIRSNMIIAMGLLESLTIYGLLIAFLLIGKLG